MIFNIKKGAVPFLPQQNDKIIVDQVQLYFLMVKKERDGKSQGVVRKSPPPDPSIFSKMNESDFIIGDDFTAELGTYQLLMDHITNMYLLIINLSYIILCITYLS